MKRLVLPVLLAGVALAGLTATTVRANAETTEPQRSVRAAEMLANQHPAHALQAGAPELPPQLGGTRYPAPPEVKPKNVPPPVGVPAQPRVAGEADPAQAGQGQKTPPQLGQGQKVAPAKGAASQSVKPKSPKPPAVKKPVGGAETGDGSLAGEESNHLLPAAGLAAVAGGAGLTFLVVRRRRSR